MNKWFYVGTNFEVIQGGRYEGNKYHFNIRKDAILNLKLLHNFFINFPYLNIIQYIFGKYPQL